MYVLFLNTNVIKVELQEKIEIQLLAVKVFSYMMEVENRRDYIPMLEEVILLDPLPLQLGSRYTEVSTIAGRKLRTTYQVVDFKENRKIGVRTIESVFPILVDISLLPLEDSNSTVMKLQMKFELTGLFKLAAPLIKGIVQQQARDILYKVKFLGILY